jgi:hypothetical protein
MNYMTSLTYELTLLLQGLDNVSSGALRPLTSDLNTPRIDSYRFSMANLEGEYRVLVIISISNTNCYELCVKFKAVSYPEQTP